MKIFVVFCCFIFLSVNLAYAQADQDKLNAIDNFTQSLVIACSSLGEADTNHMILCNNLLETIHKQCQEASFSFCITDVFGPRS
jgi:hypothetical protein